MTEIRKAIDTSIQNDETFAELFPGLYFRSSHEAFGVLAELQGEAAELSHRIDVAMNLFQRALRKNDPVEIKHIFTEIEDLTTVASEKNALLAAASRKAFISLCRVSRSLERK